MKKRIILCLFALLLLISVAGCGAKDDENDKDSNRTHEKEKSSEKEKDKAKEKEENKKDNNIDDDVIIDDDEILDIEDEDNKPPTGDGKITVTEVINCEGCVYAYFSGEGDKAKKLGDTVSEDEYTTDINNIRTAGNKQRHNFFGLVLNGNTISRAYACALKDDKIYCIEGSTNGAYHESNIAILNQIFANGTCKTISDGHTYTCTDGSYNGDSKTNGYTSLHYETSCTIYGANSNTGKLICH